MTIAYFDCFAGASGDMLVGALLDAGVDVEAWRGELAKLNLPDAFELTVEAVRKQGFAATKMTVWLGGTPADAPGEASGHAHDHAHGHAHRGLGEILDLLEGASLPAEVVAMSRRVFTRLGEAEAAVHGVSVSEVHFHEVGAVDAILDVVGFSLAYHMLGIEAAVVAPLVTGSGLVRCAHGVMPVPVPAVLELLRRSSAPTQASPVTGEALTPTGAAILTTIAGGFGPMPAFREITRIGYGAGTRDGAEVPNVLRVVLGEAT